MIEMDGDETVYATGARVLREETDVEFFNRIHHLEFEAREAIKAGRHVPPPPPWGHRRKLVPVQPFMVESAPPPSPPAPPRAGLRLVEG